RFTTDAPILEYPYRITINILTLQRRNGEHENLGALLLLELLQHLIQSLMLLRGQHLCFVNDPATEFGHCQRISPSPWQQAQNTAQQGQYQHMPKPGTSLREKSTKLHRHLDA